MKKDQSSNADHPGWKLSRRCIEDTCLAKRRGVFRTGGTVRGICATTIKNLRETQLAPHIETKMIAGRFLSLMEKKRAAPEIVVVLQGGMVQSVFSTNRFTAVQIADYDIMNPDADEAARLDAARARVDQNDMTEVW